MSGLRFPDGFVWGAATAAYQVEGATGDDGRGRSIWDTFSAVPDAVSEGHTGEVACEHYLRYGEDVKLMAGLGLNAYRFSIAWPRIQPSGSGPVSSRGLAFYDRLVDELCAAGIAPVATLYHWDLPQALQDRGGWAARETAERFGEYADVMTARLGDRVRTWFTINEPWCAAFLGYASGDHAPGITAPAQAFAAVHHLLLGHGLAAQAIAANGAGATSIALNCTAVRAGSAYPEHDEAAVRQIDGLQNRIFLEPLLRGEYPDDMVNLAERFTPQWYVKAGDGAIIRQPLDVLGLNYYTPTWVRTRPGAPGSPAHPGSEGMDFTAPTGPVTEMDWRVDATGLTDLLTRIAADYPGLPLMITENGAAYADQSVVDGQVRDTDRIAYLDAHLRAAHTAIEAGVDLRGYFAWSLMDNFEWAFGYTRRFGLVHVDYATQRRTPKASADWYRAVIAANGLT
ncbi:beta-glucosidase [Actinorhabdospora filicis]|uniref:Beta-glucosidase n=1 Tax=Actinorhabdospora filicis TaxID=1785913 RepID=A0A9W6WCF6_9ACTN|nr:GH1 family beta-glucosidase [Actinorhabdospora filicis]GLZ79730.1 beta-glucosidase [Actinorhabdospora filicis]